MRREMPFAMFALLAFAAVPVGAQGVKITPAVLDKLIAGSRAAEWVWDKFPVLEKYYNCSRDYDDVQPEVGKAMVKFFDAQEQGNKALTARARKLLDATTRKYCGPVPAAWDEDGPKTMHMKIAAKAAGMSQDDFEQVRNEAILFLWLLKDPTYVNRTNGDTDFSSSDRAAYRARLPQLKAALAKDLKYDSPES